ncbi:MAG: hypothetical protein GXP62_05260 [Oligoflexia bacterium]|nr:hypothetical protein [Oligoflexia bacterium]
MSPASGHSASSHSASGHSASSHSASSHSAPSLAFVGLDRQLYRVSLGLGAAQQITWSRVVGGLSALTGQAAPDGCGWPCWSPDGSWLAGFRASLSPDGGPTTAFIAQVDGVEEREIFARPDEHPIYLQWSPDGRALGLLCQRDEDLLLYRIDVEDASVRLVDSGVPLFFSWGADSEQLIIHAGAGTRRARLVCRAAGGSGEDVIFPASPGSFCTPLLVPGNPRRVAFATSAPGGSGSKVCTADLDATPATSRRCAVCWPSCRTRKVVEWRLPALQGARGPPTMASGWPISRAAPWCRCPHMI